MNFSGRESSQAVPHTGRADARHGTAWPAQMGLALTFAQHLKGDGIETHLPCWKGLSFFPTPAGVMRSPIWKGDSTRQGHPQPRPPPSSIREKGLQPGSRAWMRPRQPIPHIGRGFRDGFRRDGLLPRGLPIGRKSWEGRGWGLGRERGTFLQKGSPLPPQQLFTP